MTIYDKPKLVLLLLVLRKTHFNANANISPNFVCKIICEPCTAMQHRKLNFKLTLLLKALALKIYLNVWEEWCRHYRLCGTDSSATERDAGERYFLVGWD